MQDLIEQILFHNQPLSFGAALTIFIAVLLIFQLLGTVILRRVQTFAAKTETAIDDFVADLLSNTKVWFQILIAFYAGTFRIGLPVQISNLIVRIVIIVLWLQIGIWMSSAISFWVETYKRERLDKDASSVTTVSALSYIGNIILWTIVALLILDNLGIEVTSLIAGLGITGIAVALAVQNILGDLFASLTIVLDKPFVIGDFIVVGSHSGTVEKIGLKTTRLRSLLGEQIIFGNNDLLQSRINNFQYLKERRAVFSFGVRYETPYEKLKAIPDMVQEIIESREHVRFDRTHFKAYGDFALNFEVVYHVLSADFLLFMNIQQAVNLELFRRFEEEGIEFAYPTQTLILEQGRQAFRITDNR